MSHPGPSAPSPLDAATEKCLRMIRSLLDRASTRNRRLNLFFLSVLTVFLLVTLIASGLWMLT